MKRGILVLLLFLSGLGWAQKSYFGLHPNIGVGVLGLGLEYAIQPWRFSLDYASLTLSDGVTTVNVNGLGLGADYISRIALSEDKSSFFYYGGGMFLAYYFTDVASLFGLVPRVLGGVEFLLPQPEIALYLEPQLGYAYFPSAGVGDFILALQLGIYFR
jgi:hypothetical protein